MSIRLTCCLFCSCDCPVSIDNSRHLCYDFSGDQGLRSILWQTKKSATAPLCALRCPQAAHTHLAAACGTPCTLRSGFKQHFALCVEQAHHFGLRNAAHGDFSVAGDDFQAMQALLIPCALLRALEGNAKAEAVVAQARCGTKGGI